MRIFYIATTYERFHETQDKIRNKFFIQSQNEVPMHSVTGDDKTVSDCRNSCRMCPALIITIFFYNNAYSNDLALQCIMYVLYYCILLLCLQAEPVTEYADSNPGKNFLVINIKNRFIQYILTGL